MRTVGVLAGIILLSAAIGCAPPATARLTVYRIDRPEALYDEADYDRDARLAHGDGQIVALTETVTRRGWAVYKPFPVYEQSLRAVLLARVGDQPDGELWLYSGTYAERYTLTALRLTDADTAGQATVQAEGRSAHYRAVVNFVGKYEDDEFDDLLRQVRKVQAHYPRLVPPGAATSQPQGGEGH